MPDRFSLVKKGYAIEEVDTYINKTEKMLEMFKEREGAIAKAMVSAESSAQQIIKNAEIEAKAKMDEIKGSFSEYKKMIDGEKRALQEFCKEYDTVVQKYFSGTAAEITIPLKEKLYLLENSLTIDGDKPELPALTKNDFKNDGPLKPDFIKPLDLKPDLKPELTLVPDRKPEDKGPIA